MDYGRFEYGEFEQREKRLSINQHIALIQALALVDIARHLKNLGTADAATSMGALEMVASEIKNINETLLMEVFRKRNPK